MDCREEILSRLGKIDDSIVALDKRMNAKNNVEAEKRGYLRAIQEMTDKLELKLERKQGRLFKLYIVLASLIGGAMVKLLDRLI